MTLSTTTNNLDSPHRFCGVYTAIVTPFKDDQSIDFDAFDRLVTKQIEAKVSGIAISGTTGEAPTLTVQEKLSLIKRAKSLSQGTLEIIAGTGSNNTNQTVELSKLAIDAGASSLLVVTPYYNKPSLKGLIKHYQSINDLYCDHNSNPYPIVLYYVPGRTSLYLSADAITELITQVSGICAVKEASSNPISFSRFQLSFDAANSQLENPRQVSWLSGDDNGFLPTMSVGGDGVISVLSNIFPKAFVGLYQAFSSSNISDAIKIHQTLFDFVDGLFNYTNPLCVKAVLAYTQDIKLNYRLPLEALEPDQSKKIIELYLQCKEKLYTIGY